MEKIDLNNPWLLLGVGIAFCTGGALLFFRNAFEDDKSVFPPIVLMLGGVLLISIALAKFYHVIR